MIRVVMVVVLVLLYGIVEKSGDVALFLRDYFSEPPSVKVKEEVIVVKEKEKVEPYKVFFNMGDFKILERDIVLLSISLIVFIVIHVILSNNLWQLKLRTSLMKIWKS